MKYTLKFCIAYLFFLFPFVGMASDTLKFNGYKDFANYTTSTFKQKYPSLTFLKYRLITPQYNIFDFYRGGASDSVCNVLKYLSMVNDLDIANFQDDSKINLKYLEDYLFENLRKGVEPISFSLLEYSSYKDSTIALGYVSFQNNKFIDNSPSNYFPFKKDTLFAASVLNQVINHNQINFLLNDSLLLSNINTNDVDSILIDFDDGGGFRPISLGHSKTVTYTTRGNKIITTKIKIGTKEFISKCSIDIEPEEGNNKSVESVQYPDEGPVKIETSILGTYVSGHYAIWYSHCNPEKKIRKPFIVSVGYNPSNSKQLVPGLINSSDYFSINFLGIHISIPTSYQWNGEWRGTFYETYNGVYNKRFAKNDYDKYGATDNGNELLDRVRDEGYDVIILMYDKGDDATINNAALYMQLVNEINEKKIQNGYYFENVACGFSGGAITTRMALALMESRYKQGIGKNPHTKMWISFEGEHQGANIPLGFQYFAKFQSESSNIIPSSSQLQVQADQINQLAAYLAKGAFDTKTANEIMAFNSSAAGNGPHGDRIALLNTFSSIPLNSTNGYPEFCRRIGISQGSGIGTMVTYTSSIALDSYLGTNLSSIQTNLCGNSYTWVGPKAEKQTTARWWSQNNNQNIFDAKITVDASATIAPPTCIWTPWSGCVCTDPFTLNLPISLKESHVAKPSNPPNYDDSPASLLSAHIELYEYSAYSFYNNSLLLQAHSDYDHNLNSFTPVSSALDLHDPSTGLSVSTFTSPFSLNLMYKKPTNLTDPQEPNLRYGFPYISYPNNHYKVTPFDAIFAIGINNGFYFDGTPKPDNQFHVEAPQKFIGDYLARVEVAPEDLFLSNRNIGTTPTGFVQSSSNDPYIAEFEARDKIFVGNGIYSLNGNQDYLTPDGDFNVDNYSHAIIHAGDAIELLPGTNVDLGAELEAYIESYDCANLLKRPSTTNNSDNESNIYSQITGINVEDKNSTNSRILSKVTIYPNPNNGLLTIENNSGENNSILRITDLTGKTVYSTNTKNTVTEINLSQLENGIYIVEINTNNTIEHSKIILSK